MRGPEARSSGLPEVLDQVAEVAGLQLAASLAKACGGRRFYFPKPENLRARHPAARALAAEGVSLKDARLIAGALGGWVDVPFGPFVGAKEQLRRQRAVVKRALRQGATKHAAARESGLTERTVYRIQAETPDDRQGRLFPEELP